MDFALESNELQAWWQRRLQPGAIGVCRSFTFDPNAKANKSIGLPADARPYKGLYAVVFFDFSAFPPRKDFCNAPSVESFQASRGLGGPPQFRRLHWDKNSPVPTLSL